jgi:hypothetical protein
MPVRLVDPRNEAARVAAPAAARLPALSGRTLALVDISKPGGSVFLDRLAERLRAEHRVAVVTRVMKPTFSKRAPAGLLDRMRDAEAVVLALAD